MANDNGLSGLLGEQAALNTGTNISAEERANNQKVFGTLNAEFEENREEWLNRIIKSMGGGGFNTQYQTFFHGIDRFQHNFVPSNVEHSGLTFITRPRLCLVDTSVRQRPEFAPLDTLDYSSIGFVIRCLLDTQFARDHLDLVNRCPMLDSRNPFFTPIMNGLQSVSGYPDPTIQTQTTDAGFHSEDQTFVTGYDQLNKSYDLTLTFKDIQEGPLAATFFYWMLYMGYVAKGIMPAYMTDIEALRMNYTVSIYRFNLDPTRRFITKYSKATGCFPKSVPLGSMFNYSEAELFNPDAGKFSIPFAVNKLEYCHYPSLIDFNMLVKKYNPGLDLDYKTPIDTIGMDASHNYEGIPWVDTSTGRLRLVFLNDKHLQPQVVR